MLQEQQIELSVEEVCQARERPDGLLLGSTILSKNQLKQGLLQHLQLTLMYQDIDCA